MVGVGQAQARFAASNVVAGILISAPPELDLPRPFNLASNVDTISIDSEGGFASSQPTLRYEFFAVPIRRDR